MWRVRDWGATEDVESVWFTEVLQEPQFKLVLPMSRHRPHVSGVDEAHPLEAK